MERLSTVRVSSSGKKIGDHAGYRAVDHACSPGVGKFYKKAVHRSERAATKLYAKLFVGVDPEWAEEIEEIATISDAHVVHHISECDYMGW